MKKLLVAALTALALVPGGAVAARPDRAGGAIDGKTGIEMRGQEPRRLPALTRYADDALTGALDSGDLSEAQYALERARSLFARKEVAARYGPIEPPHPRGATMILRDLAIRLDDLKGADLADAKSLLARPTAPNSATAYRPGSSQHKCDGDVCVHWAPPMSTEAQADQTLAVFNFVYDTEVTGFGYRAPKSDQTSPGNLTSGLDIYLEDLGSQGLYGYCTTDDPNAGSSSYPYGDVSAYCSVDNDFSATQFPGSNTPLENLQVTAAHEFFHAVQFAYDVYEDAWMMEGTAAWIEDEVYDAVNDHYQYLHQSHLTYPGVPLDIYVPPSEGVFMYGTWLFFRFLTEHVGTRDLVREIWAVADAAPGGVDHYSLTAIDAVLKAKGTNFRFIYADFAAANYVVDAAYEEGAAYLDEVGYPPEFVKKLTAKNPKFTGFAELDHLTSAYAAFRPGKGILKKFGKKAKLRVTVDTPPAIEGGEATVMNIFNDGSFSFAPLQMSAEGNGFIVVPFKPKKVFQTAVILSNGSIRMKDCFQGTTPFSCFGGTPLDDGDQYIVKVKVVRP